MSLPDPHDRVVDEPVVLGDHEVLFFGGQSAEKEDVRVQVEAAALVEEGVPGAQPRLEPDRTATTA